MDAEGYVLETEYTHKFFGGLNPTLMAFSALLQGCRPVPTHEPFTYFELGCGTGLTTNILAASNPHARFYANDFNPAHIHRANDLARRAKLRNATFMEDSFAGLHDRELPPCDFITMHGIYSWVSAENRRHILRFIRERLKPGGMVYVSYNCAAGYASFQPVRHLLKAIAAQAEGPLEQRIGHAFAVVQGLIDYNAPFFQGNPGAAQIFRNFRKRSVKYLAHELFNDHWTLFSPAEVAAEMAEAGLGYAASGDLRTHFPQFIMGRESLPVYRELARPGTAEALSVFLVSQQFRLDIFQRDLVRISGAEREKLLRKQRVALVVPVDKCVFEVKIPAGQLHLKREHYLPLLEALRTRPCMLGQLYEAAEKGISFAAFVQQVAKLCIAGYIAPALQEDADKAAAARFNKVLLKEPEEHRFLASAVLGSGYVAAQAVGLGL